MWLCKKRSHTPWKFQLEIRSNKKVIAKKPLTNLYEMNSSLFNAQSAKRNRSAISKQLGSAIDANMAFHSDRICLNLILPKFKWMCQVLVMSVYMTQTLIAFKELSGKGNVICKGKRDLYSKELLSFINCFIYIYIFICSGKYVYI